ncbi:PadR family transcriptional regulator [Microbacterium sp. ARD32]|uniref:PadR family transcriptional regulator n=1 Tax=Microbacterium sp. ARD32 TaxID=2962577 RepID=UPI002881BB2B|nr:PadR family transcriptional regulator [Microbacterium sp. ARD32]MDT0156796.1 PadR family transcriptional regulator [Microbacterium sp. ARD32]
MSVRQSLLAILDQGPCYGYQLRAEFDRRTGSTWPLNVGQIYNTLERLERDGLVRKGDIDDQGHVYYEITDAGRAEVRDWLDSPVLRQAGTRDELPIKLALAATLPGVDVAAIVQRQRKASLAALQELRRVQFAGAAGGEELAWQLVADSLIFQAEAEVRWLDHVESRLTRHTPQALELELSMQTPRRGRPPRTTATATSGSAS